MVAAALAFLFHCLFGPLVALLIVIAREGIVGRPVSKWLALFGLIPLVGWPLAAFWPSPRYPDPNKDPRYWHFDPRQGYEQR